MWYGQDLISMTESYQFLTCDLRLSEGDNCQTIYKKRPLDAHSMTKHPQKVVRGKTIRAFKVRVCVIYISHHL